MDDKIQEAAREAAIELRRTHKHSPHRASLMFKLIRIAETRHAEISTSSDDEDLGVIEHAFNLCQEG